MPNQPTLYGLTGAALIDGTGAPPLPNATIIVDGWRIAAVGPAGTVPLPDGLATYELAGRTLMPGLIDGHVHLRSYAGDGQKDVHLWNVLTFIEEQAIHCAGNALRALESGVTTVRDMAGARPEIAARHAIAESVLPGARIVVAGFVGMTAGHGDMFFPACVDHRMWRTADGPDECRKLVREYARDGADLIKICTSGGVLSMGDKAGWRNYTVDETRVIVDEAHALGMRVAAHAHSRAGIRRALNAGVDTLEHGSNLDDELIEMMVAQGTWLCPTLAIGEFVLTHGESRGVPAESLAKAREMADIRRDSVRRAYRAGVRVFMGTDSCNTMAFGRHAWELELMQRDMGLTSMKAIVAATSAAAEALSLGSVTGTIEPRKRADLLVIAGDPLADLTLLQDRDRILGVVRDGRVLVDRGMPEPVTTRAAQPAEA